MRSDQLKPVLMRRNRSFPSSFPGFDFPFASLDGDPAGDTTADDEDDDDDDDEDVSASILDTFEPQEETDGDPASPSRITRQTNP
ncbi:hypothetical protein QQF64_022406 [Cirrhinus molitorella]|uniref:Uncharacterized protein n=1 Tax=Cirrhinus molitorella TaxID=172907 RepID=A0ABR3L8D9_9TELE